MPDDKPDDTPNGKLYKDPAPGERVPAWALHHHAEEVRYAHLMHDMEERRLQMERDRRAHFDFLAREFTERDRQHVKDLIGAAVHQGAFEAEVLRFPGWYLEDRGRAINNGEPDWPRSLVGYGKCFYDAFVDLMQPLGYRIEARVLDYPHGMIGDIALFMKW